MIIVQKVLHRKQKHPLSNTIPTKPGVNWDRVTIKGHDYRMILKSSRTPVCVNKYK